MFCEVLFLNFLILKSNCLSALSFLFFLFLVIFLSACSSNNESIKLVTKLFVFGSTSFSIELLSLSVSSEFTLWLIFSEDVLLLEFLGTDLAMICGL